MTGLEDKHEADASALIYSSLPPIRSCKVRHRFRFTSQQDGEAVRAMIYNHTEHPRTFLYDHRYQPAELARARRAAITSSKIFAPPKAAPPGADPVYKKMYIKLAPKQSAWLDEGRVSGSSVERFVISFGEFRTPY